MGDGGGGGWPIAVIGGDEGGGWPIVVISGDGGGGWSTLVDVVGNYWRWWAKEVHNGGHKWPTTMGEGG